MGYFTPCVTSLISYWYSWNAIYKLQGQYCPVACRYTTDDEALFDSHDILRNTSIYQNNSIKTCLLEFNITVTIKEKWKLFVECRFQNSYKIVINMFLLDSTLNKSPQHGFFLFFFHGLNEDQSKRLVHNRGFIWPSRLDVWWKVVVVCWCRVVYLR